MMTEIIYEIRKLVKIRRPLIHCITNPISIRSCADVVLAVGGSPMMAEHPGEVAEITASAGALVLNLGNITDVRMASMKISADEANQKKIPIILDLVGVACSKLRRDFAFGLLKTNQLQVIKGNYSEIRAMYDLSYHSSGVDAETYPSEDAVAIGKIAELLARQYDTVVLASGPVDLVTDGEVIFYIKNGVEQLAHVTGTGCMLGALCGCYLAGEAVLRRGFAQGETQSEILNGELLRESPLPKVGTLAAVTACTVQGICGELSETPQGNGSFLVKFLDHLSTIDEITWEQHLKWEIYQAGEGVNIE